MIILIADGVGYESKNYISPLYLKMKNASDALTVTKITLLCGPSYFEDSQTGIKKAL